MRPDTAPGGAAVLVCVISSLAAAAMGRPQALTAAPAGPYCVKGNRLVDAGGHPYLIRGTRLPPVPKLSAAVARPSPEFGPLSATVLITIRQRLNMNAVRLPVYPEEYEREPAYRELVESVVRLANRLELLVIIEAADTNEHPGDSLAGFWADCSAAFRSNPNVIFAISGPPLPSFTAAIRASGAVQPIIVPVSNPFPASDPGIADPNLIYQASPHYPTTRTDRDRWDQFGSLAEDAPVLVDGFDPELDRDSDECAAFPNDPAEATRLVEDNLAYFDAHNISWTLSAFRPGRLITDYRFLNGSKLDDGWTCGKPADVAVGLGLLLLSHLWSAPDTHGLFAVNGTRGGLVLPRGGISTAYGPILAEREMSAGPPPLPRVLGNVSVRVTDSLGVARLAPLLYTGAGWAFLSFVVPPNAALGPAKVEIIRSDGSSTAARVIIDDVAPGLFTATADGRGPVVGQVTQEFRDGTRKTFPASQCAPARGCHTVPVPLSRRASTTVRLVGAGFRNAGLRPRILVWIGEVPVPVVSAGPGSDPGTDQLTIRLPGKLRGIGEADLFFTVNGILSNVVRINCGAS